MKDQVKELNAALEFLVGAAPRNANKHKLLVDWYQKWFGEKGRGSYVTEAKQAYNRPIEQFKHHDPHVMFVYKDADVPRPLIKTILNNVYPKLQSVVLVNCSDGTFVPEAIWTRNPTKVSEFFTSEYPKVSVERLDGGTVPITTDASLLNAFNKTCEAAKLRLPDKLQVRFLASLCAKRFVILTGLSGCGKTRLAKLFAEWVTEGPDQYVIVPVGADWTSRENLFGYPDALTPGEYCQPSNGVLQLIINAEKDWQSGNSRPYILILDEMNLSHVERYFADVLSAMESDGEIPLHELRTFAERNWGGIPVSVTIPPNLFIIGTVNVDETTYMFSPKVLDRANVIEFTASSKDVVDFLRNPAPLDYEGVATTGKEFGILLVTQASSGSSLTELTEKGQTRSVAERVTETIVEAFNAMALGGAEFGYRSTFEIVRLIFYYSVVAGPDWRVDDSLDAAIMQKLLPKLHGSKIKLGPVLAALKKTVIRERFPISFEKIERMELRLKQNGFTSYSEA